MRVASCQTAPQITLVIARHIAISLLAGRMLAFAVAVWLGLMSPVCAQTSYWSGGNGVWSSNFVPGWNGWGVPDNGDWAYYNGNVTSTTIQDLGFGVSVGAIVLSGSSNIAWTHTLANPITISNGSYGHISNYNTSTGATNSLILGAGTLQLDNYLSIGNYGGSTNSAGSIRINSTIGGIGTLSIYNVSNNVDAGAIRIQTATNTFTGDVYIRKGATTFSNANSFGNDFNNTITLGEAGEGSTTLLSTIPVGYVYYPIIVAAGSGGTLLLGSNSGASSGHTSYFGPITLNGNLSLTSKSIGTGYVYLGGDVSGPGRLRKVGDGNAGIYGTNSYQGGTLVVEGTLDVYFNQSSANGGWTIGPDAVSATTVNFLSGSTIAVASGKLIQIGNNSASGTEFQNLNVAGGVTNSGTLYVGRRGVLNINSGGVWTQHDTMSINGHGDSGSSITVNAGSVVYAGTDVIAINPASGSVGNTTLSVAGGGTFTTGCAFSNTVASSSGVAAIRLGDTNVATGTGTLRLSANVATLTSTAGSDFVFQLGGGGGVIDTNGFSTTMSRAISNVIGQTGGLTKAGSGTLTLSGLGNSYTGTTAINAGVLRISGGDDRLPLGTAVTFANVTGAELDLNSLNQTIGSLSGGGTTGGNISLGSGTLTVGDVNTTTYSGVISGVGGNLVKQGIGTLTAFATHTYTGNTTVNAGTLNLAKLENGASTTVAAAGILNVGNNGVGSIRQALLTVHGLATVVASSPSAIPAVGNNNGTSHVGTLTMGNGGGSYPRTYNGTLDLKNNDLIVDYGSLSDVTDALRSGSNSAFWNGTGLTSSTAAASSGATALGVIQNFVNPATGSSGLMYATFDGISAHRDGSAFNGSEILVKYTYAGDFNLDGKVDSHDFALLDAGFAGTTQLVDGKPGWFFGDANYSGTVDSQDYALALNGYNAYWGAYGSATLPEPSPLLLGVLGVAGLLAAYRRSRLVM